MNDEIPYKARSFWEAVNDIADADAALRRYDTLKREASVDLNRYATAIAYLLYPWYAAHAGEVDRSGSYRVFLVNVARLVHVAMQQPTMKAPDSMFQKFVFHGRLVPDGDRVPLIVVDHKAAQEIVSFIVSKVGTDSGPLPPSEHMTLVHRAQVPPSEHMTLVNRVQDYYRQTIEAPASDESSRVELAAKAKSMLCLIDDLDVEVPQRSVEQLKALASGKPTTSSGTKESYSPVWVHPEFKLAKNIGKPPFNIVVLNTPDNSKDDTDVEK